MKIFVIIIIIIVLYIIFRYKKNEYEVTLGLVKSNLSVYYSAVFDGFSDEKSLNIMIVSRFINNPLYTQKEISHYIEQLKYIVLSDVNRMDKKNIVIKILTIIYQIENPNLSDKMKSRHKNKIISSIEKYWNNNQNHILNEPSRDVKMDNPNNKIVCPECGSIMQDPDWRCPECNSEFENYNFELNILEGDPIVKKKQDSKSSNDTCIQTAIDSVKDIFNIINEPFTESQIKILKTESQYEINSINDAISSGKRLYLPSVDNILSSEKYDDSFLQYYDFNPEITKIASCLFRGFFMVAQEGYHFLDPERIKKTFGKDISTNYPNSSQEFIMFAETFWTLKILHNDLFYLNRYLIITQVFGWLEFSISSIFFPIPGPRKIPRDIHRQAQQNILKKVGYNKIDEVINGSPYL